MATRVSVRRGEKAATKPTKKAAPKAKAEKVGRTPRRTSEETLLERYPHMVPGSLHFAEDGAHANKQVATIRCQESGCKNTRVVATSDLFQVKRCAEHAKASRSAKLAALRSKSGKKASKPKGKSKKSGKAK